MLVSLVKGFSASAGLIMAIGSQNAFVIRQGLLRQHLLLTALICSLIDACLITLGVAGFGGVIAEYPACIVLAKYFAIAFLLFYGAVSLQSAFKSKSLAELEETAIVSAKRTVYLLLAFSLLNPHVYLDTVLLLGSIASQLPTQDQVYFVIGAIAASFCWFFTITYGSRLLAPLFKKEISWKIIDSIVAFSMWAIAISLFLNTID